MTIRVGGLASGMDTENIIKDLMKIERTKVDRQYQQRQVLEWKRDDFRDVNTRLLDLKNKVFDLKLNNTFNARSVSSSNESIVTATANSDAITGTYLVKVKQLAEKASMSSQTSLGSSGDNSNIATQFGIAEGTNIKFTLKGKDGEIAFDFAAEDATMTQIVDGINKADIGINAYYDKSVDRFFLMSSEFGAESQITVKLDAIEGSTKSFLGDYLKLDVDYNTANSADPADGRKITSLKPIGETPPAATDLLSSLYDEGESVDSTVEFTLEGSNGSFDFSFATTSTIQDLVNGINAQKAVTGIGAEYDETTGEFALYNSTPTAELKAGSDNTSAVLEFTEELYQSSDGTPTGVLTGLNDGDDITALFDYTDSDGNPKNLGAATYQIDAVTGEVTIDFDFAAGDAPAAGDTIILGSDAADNIFDAEGNPYAPVAMTFNGTNWEYSNPGNPVIVRNDDQDFLGQKLNLAMFSQTGTNAVVDFNDATDLEFGSNEFTLNNINFNLQSSDPGKDILLTVDYDTDEAVDKIKAFVESYNSLMEYVNNKLSEKRYRDFPPLTDEQKADMKEKQIELWESKAHSGLLKGDPIIRSLELSISMETNGVLTNRVNPGSILDPNDLVEDNKYRSLSAIGITTGSYAENSADNGKLIIDEDELREALETDADAVMKLFTATQSQLVDGQAVEYNTGIACRLYDQINSSIKEVTEKAGVENSIIDNSLISKEIAEVDERIEWMVDRMEALENRYWKQFTAMEKAIQQMTTQGDWLMQKMAEMQGGQ